MSHRFMPTDRAIAMHLSKSAPTEEVEVFSGFVKGLTESREATGRNPSTGEKIPGQDHSSWLGAIGYMALLDQIGSCFKPKTATTKSGNAIVKALGYFSILSSQEIDAIYALRCAFAHDFSLYNINNKNPSLTHCFKVSGGSTGTVITLPMQPWSGDYEKKPDNNHTLVNLELFGDLIEDICHKLFSFANSNELEVTLTNGSDELLQRYSFFRRLRTG